MIKPDSLRTLSSRLKSRPSANGANSKRRSKPLSLECAQPGGAVPTAGPDAGSISPPTTVAVRVDVGFGNALYIRGQGAGLSWEKGTPLACLAASTWLWSAERVPHPIVFKLLLNDQVWAQGEDVTVAPGERVELVPLF